MVELAKEVKNALVALNLVSWKETIVSFSEIGESGNVASLGGGRIGDGRLHSENVDLERMAGQSRPVGSEPGFGA